MSALVLVSYVCVAVRWFCEWRNGFDVLRGCLFVRIKTSSKIGFDLIHKYYVCIKAPSTTSPPPSPLQTTVTVLHHITSSRFQKKNTHSIVSYLFVILLFVYLLIPSVVSLIKYQIMPSSFRLLQDDIHFHFLFIIIKCTLDHSAGQHFLIHFVYVKRREVTRREKKIYIYIWIPSLLNVGR